MLLQLSKKLFASTSDGGKLLVQRTRILTRFHRNVRMPCRPRNITYNRCIGTNKYVHNNNVHGVPSNIQHGNKSFHSSILSSVYEKSHYWDYSEVYGPSNWEYVWESGTCQSPIDICTKDVVYDGALGPFTFDRTPIDLSYVNNGVNAIITPKDDKNIIISNGPLVFDGYEFMQFHFHYGEENTCGCEHTIDGHRYAAELHIVHFNRMLYNDKNTAFYNADGLAVLGIFLDASEEYSDNSDVDVILKAFDNILYEGDKYTPPDALSVYDMLPRNTDDYFTYAGSLTTPPLTENVIWTVFREPIKISKRQQKEFTKLYAVHYDDKDKVCMHDPCVRAGDHIPQPPNICNNYRETQPVHERVIRSSFTL